MNLALWLQRAGLSYGDAVAIASGARAVRRYRQAAERAARLAGALRERLGLAQRACQLRRTLGGLPVAPHGARA